MAQNQGMTRLIGIITKEGIVAATDGRSVTVDHKQVSDNEVKIYQMSNHCAVMVSGVIFSDIGKLMTNTAATYNQFHIIDVTKIASSLRLMFKDIKKHVSGWIDDPSTQVVFMVAGYDLNKEGNFEPHLYYIQKNPDWDVYAPKPSPLFAQAGNDYVRTKKLLAAKYSPELSIKAANSLVAEAIRQASIDEPIYIGGQTRLWNIVPMQPLKKFSPNEIKNL